MKTKLLIVTLILSTLIMSCAPSAMVIDRSGTEFLMEKITPVGESLPFRTTSGVSDLILKNLAALSVDASETEVYGGDTWIRATITYAVDETTVDQNGWIKMSSRLKGNCPSGFCQLDLVKLREFDFVMEEVVEVIDSNATLDPALIEDQATTETSATEEGE